jgi:xanthine dehydrogenase YagR molybdenum-binding subunit
VAERQQPPAQQPPPSPAATTARWPPPAERVHIGKPIKRLDGPDKAAGRAKYTYDIVRPGMLYGKMLTSPHPHARVRSIDLSAAEKLPGVKAAILLKDTSKPEVARVRYQGEEVAAVAATTEEIAMDAVRLIKVDYEVLPHLATVEQAMRPEAPQVFEKGNFTQPTARGEGDVEGALKASAHVVEGLYNTQVQTHTSLETHGGICEWKDDQLTAWVSTQAVHATREGVARALGVQQNNVRVITDYMGGGFGSKLGGDLWTVICARLAKAANAPVKLMLDRKEEHLVTGNRPSAYAKIRAGVDAQGKLTAIDAQTWGTGGAGQGSNFPVPYQVYVFPVTRQRHTDAYINAGPQRAFRAPGHPQSCFVTEIVMDELADRLRMDPLEFRLRNLPPEADNAQWGKYFKMGAEKFDWGKRHPTGDPASGPIKRGMGCAANRWAGQGSRQSRAACEINPDGSVVMRIGTQDIGTGTRTVFAQVVAEELGLRAEDINIHVGDTEYPPGPPSGGSRVTSSLTPAARNAAYAAARDIAARVAPLLATTKEQIVFRDGRIGVRNHPEKSLSFAEALRRADIDSLVHRADRQEDYQGYARKAGDLFISRHAIGGVQFAEVVVDTDTGVVKVERVVAVHDCGRPINPKLIESQIIGGVIQGVSYALYEDRRLDGATGVQLNANIDQYKIVGARETPRVEAHIIEQIGRQSSTDARGVAEPANVATAAAVANAFFNATGRRIYTLPMTPANVLAALGTE